jgi:hypothetical protein
MDANASNLTLACSLSAAEYAERLRAFRRLFARSIQEVRREPTRLQIMLDADTAEEAEERDLLRREAPSAAARPAKLHADERGVERTNAGRARQGIYALDGVTNVECNS